MEHQIFTTTVDWCIFCIGVYLDNINFVYFEKNMGNHVRMDIFGHVHRYIAVFAKSTAPNRNIRTHA